MTYEPVRIGPKQAITRLHNECQELADFVFGEPLSRRYIHVGAVKRLLRALIDTGRLERARAVVATLETLSREGNPEVRNMLAVGLLEHLPDLGATRLESVKGIMGPATRHLYDDVLAYNEALLKR